MKSVIVGTAGHIDHGKTALVKALTGIDADRLEEEKRRGITIDIGFAHLELPSPEGNSLRLGFVDVPGHERFVRNMLAGIGGIDLVLLVIAADESIKPQTREHFDICRLLGIRRGITVLTKSDLVDSETLDVVKLEIEEFLRGSFLDSAPIVPVSAKSGQGLPAFKQALAKVAADVPAKDATALARLPIDRVFTMKGFGTVVTGTLISGVVRKEDELEVFPTGQQVRVRGIQVHEQVADQASAGQRTALNLSGVATEDLSRGMSLAPRNTFQKSNRVDVSLSLLPSSRPLEDQSRVHLHLYTTETVARVVLLQPIQVEPGQHAYAQLRLAKPVLALPGDRFIVRQFSPLATIGGGVVLDAFPLNRVLSDARRHFLQTLDHDTPAASLLARIERRGAAGLSAAQAVQETGARPEHLNPLLAEALQERSVVRISDRFVNATALEELRGSLLAFLKDFHDKNPLVPGIPRETLRETSAADPVIFTAAIDLLIRENKLALAGELLRITGRGVVMKDEEAESKRIIETAFSSAGLKVPALKDVLAGLKVDKVRAQQIVTLLLRDKVLVKVSEELVFHQSVLAGLRKQIIAEKTKSPKMDVARFKDLTGVSRKYAIPLLEYLDRERVTRRIGDERIIL